MTAKKRYVIHINNGSIGFPEWKIYKKCDTMKEAMEWIDADELVGRGVMVLEDGQIVRQYNTKGAGSDGKKIETLPNDVGGVGNTY